MKNGQRWTMPGMMNPEIVDAAGPIDPQVGLIGAWTLDGKLLGTIVNFSCHATTSPGGGATIEMADICMPVSLRFIARPRIGRSLTYDVTIDSNGIR